MTEREYDNDVLRRFARGEAKYSPLKRARLAGEAAAILRERGLYTDTLDDHGLVELAKVELAR